MDLPQESRVSPYTSSSQPPQQQHHSHQPQHHFQPHSQEPHPSSHPSLPSSSSVTQPSPDMYEEDNIDIRDPWPRTPVQSLPGFRHTNQLSRPVCYDRSTYHTDRFEQGHIAPYNDYPHTSSSPYRGPHHHSDRHSRGDPPPKDHHSRNGFPSASSYWHQADIASARLSFAPSLPSSNYSSDTRTEAIGRDEGRSDSSQDSRYLQYSDPRHSQQQHFPRHNHNQNQSQNQKNYDHYGNGPHNHNDNRNNNHNIHHRNHQQPYDYASDVGPDMLAHNHTTPNRPPFDHFADSARPESTLPVPAALTNKGATSMLTPSATSTSTSTSTATSTPRSVSASTSMAMAATTPSKIASPSATPPVSLLVSLPPSAAGSEGREGRDGREKREGGDGPSHTDSATAHVLFDYARPDPGNADTRARDRAHENSTLTRERTHHPSLARTPSSSSLSPVHDDPLHQRPPPQRYHQGAVSVSVSKRDPHDDGEERRYSIDPRWNDSKYHPYPSASASGYLMSGPPHSPSTTIHNHMRLQNHHVWDGAEPNGSTVNLPSPSTSTSSVYTPPLSLHAGPSYPRSLQPSSSQAHSKTQPPRPPSIQHPEDQRQEPNLPDPNLESNDEDEDEDYDDESWQSAKNLGFKFGTEMPTTIDLKAAIDSCDTLCKFALHYAQQSQDYPPQGYSDPGSLLLEEHERTTLQAIRSMSSAMLLGLRVNKECDKDGKDGKDKETTEGGEDPFKSAPSEQVFNPESSIKFGTGAPSDKMVQELAKAATSIFQLAIRIKAWVNMTPEERELDEEINIIRGKRCLVMDGSSSLPPDQFGHPQMDWAMLQAKSTFHTPMEKRVQHHQESISKGMDSMDLDRQFGGGGEGVHDGHFSFAPGAAGSKAKNKTVIKGGNSSKDESAPHQKYRKRAKRTHPPGRCMSCDSSDTPEWRRGPDGARTLCNACGLHYAKLLKRQNKEHKIKQEQQLQFISFPFRKRAKSQSPEAHRNGSKEPDTMRAENDRPLEQDMLIEPGQQHQQQQQQQQQSSPFGQGSVAPPSSIGTSEYVSTVAPVSTS